jgi:hypothetical protein
LAGGAAEQPAGSARAHTRLGVLACGRSAWWPRRSGCRLCCRHRVRVRVWHPVSSVRCERPVFHGAGPRDRCPVRASERPGVHCPASGVRALRRPLCPTGMRSRGVAMGQEPHGWDGRGRRGRPPCPRRRVVCPLALEAGAGRAGPAEGRLGPGRRGRWLAVGQVDRERLGCARASPVGSSWRRPRCVVNMGPRGKAAWSLEAFPAEL